MWRRARPSITGALATALLWACPRGTERPQTGTSDNAAPSPTIGAFGDGAVPDTASAEGPAAGADTAPAGGRPATAGTSDTAPVPTVPTRPGVVDTGVQGPAGPGVMDTAVAGPVIGPHTIRRTPAGTLDTAAATLPSRRAITAPARPLPGVHR